VRPRDKRRTCRAGRFIVASGPAVYLASPSASQAVAHPQIPAESALFFFVHVVVRRARHNVGARAPAFRSTSRQRDEQEGHVAS